MRVDGLRIGGPVLDLALSFCFGIDPMGDVNVFPDLMPYYSGCQKNVRIDGRFYATLTYAAIILVGTEL